MLIIFITSIGIVIVIVSLLFRKKIQEVVKNNHIDDLTGLKNHKVLHEYLNLKIQEYKKKSDSLSIIILDIDDFKAFNTKFGFNVADQVLKKLWEFLNNDKRITDETFRYFYRGDEFIVVASETSLNQAFQAAERKRKSIEKTFFSVDGKNYELTVCCGVTELKGLLWCY